MSASNSTSTPRGHISSSEGVLPGWPGLTTQLVNGGVGAKATWSVYRLIHSAAARARFGIRKFLVCQGLPGSPKFQ
jgi:hypothetical protein